MRENYLKFRITPSLMIKPSDYSQLSKEANIIIFKDIAKHSVIRIHNENVLEYLSDLVEKVNNPANQELFLRYKCENRAELDNLLLMNEIHYHNPSEMNLLFSQNSGEFILNQNALRTGCRNYDFISHCYSLAFSYCVQMGREKETTIFGPLAVRIEKYVKLLAEYYKYFKENPQVMNALV